MTSLTFVLLSGTLSFGVPMALALRELFTLAAPPLRGRDDPPPEGRFSPAPKPLPTCLLPPRTPFRRSLVRALEDA